MLLSASVATAQIPAAPAPEAPATESQVSVSKQSDVPWWARVRIDGADACQGCRLEPSPPPRADAPWSIQRHLRVGGERGSFSLGVVGRRNAALPLFLSTPIAGEYQPPPPSSSALDLSKQEIDWTITIGLRRRLLTTAGGATLDLVADTVIPSSPTKTPDPKTSTQSPSRVGRLGLGWQW